MREYFDQPAYLSTWELRLTVHGRRGSTQLLILALLDMTHQPCPGFLIITVAMVVGMAALKVTGKRKSPVRSQILPSPILFKEVTATKNPCSLDAFLVVEMLIKRRITAHTRWSGGIRLFPCISTSRNTLVSVSDELLQCSHHAL